MTRSLSIAKEQVSVLVECQNNVRLNFSLADSVVFERLGSGNEALVKTTHEHLAVSGRIKRQKLSIILCRIMPKKDSGLSCWPRKTSLLRSIMTGLKGGMKPGVLLASSPGLLLPPSPNIMWERHFGSRRGLVQLIM